MTKISEPQVRVLKSLASGDRLLTCTGRRASAFLAESLKTVRLDTIHALSKAGYLERTNDGVAGAEYVLTEKGREAVQ